MLGQFELDWTFVPACAKRDVLEYRELIGALAATLTQSVWSIRTKLFDFHGLRRLLVLRNCIMTRHFQAQRLVDKNSPAFLPAFKCQRRGALNGPSHCQSASKFDP
jgi:hypothetical protein